MTFEMLSNGTIGHWTASDGTNILFPEQQLAFGQETKLRGGAPVCVPNFGDAPTDDRYQGIALPKHGLVRDCRNINGSRTKENRAFAQSESTVSNDWTVTNFIFDTPWSFEAVVAMKLELDSMSGNQDLRHRISMSDIMGDGGIPYSIGFHPYFATNGEGWSMYHGEHNWTVYGMPVNQPVLRFVRSNNRSIYLRTSHGEVEVQLVKGYNAFCVWTDRPDHYVCIEPVCISQTNKPFVLDQFEQVDCECLIRYNPIE